MISKEAIKVILIEDDIDLRESIQQYLTIAGYRVTAVGSGRAFYREIDQTAFSIAVIDIGLPDQSGLVLAEYLRANTTTGIIILTARDTDEDQLRGYESGADLYLTKPVTSMVLGSAISSLANRLKTTQPANNSTMPELTLSPWLLYKNKWTILSPHGHSVTLTSLELRLLELLATSQNNQTSRELLLNSLYEYSDEYTGRALDALVRRLRNKLARLPSPTNPIKSIYGVGYCFTEPLFIN